MAWYGEPNGAQYVHFQAKFYYSYILKVNQGNSAIYSLLIL